MSLVHLTGVQVSLVQVTGPGVPEYPVQVAGVLVSLVSLVQVTGVCVSLVEVPVAGFASGHKSFRGCCGEPSQAKQCCHQRQNEKVEKNKKGNLLYLLQPLIF